MIRFLLILLLAGCAASSSPALVYRKDGLFYPAVEAFPHCRSYGCAKIDTVSLSQDDIDQISSLFTNLSDAKSERGAVKQAVALFERKVGARTGTAADIGGTYVRLGHLQHDCVDESTNTTTYLVLLDDLGLLRFHDVNALTSRAPILSGRLGPHRTAVMTDRETGIKYAVDSWFHDNGYPPEIVPLETWRRGWHP